MTGHRLLALGAASAVGLLVLAWAVARDEDGTGGTATPVASLRSSPARLDRDCRDVAARKELIVRCPRRLPGAAYPGRLRIAHRDLASGRDAYLIDAEIDGGRGETPFHVIVGGTAATYSTRTRGDRWPSHFPADDPLRLVPEEPLKPGQTTFRRQRVHVLARSTAGGSRMIVLQEPDYPLGGLHGGHVVALVQHGAASYVVSLHYGRNGSSSPVRQADPPSPQRQAQLVIASARSLAAVAGGERGGR